MHAHSSVMTTARSLHLNCPSAVPQRLQNTASGSLMVSHERRSEWSAGDAIDVGSEARGVQLRGEPRPFLKTRAQLALDELAVPRAASIELLHQHDRTRAEPSRHLVEVLARDTFPIARSNSSSLIDRSTSAFSRSSAARARSEGRSPSTRHVAYGERHDRAIDRSRGCARGADRQADEDEMFRRRLPRQDRPRRWTAASEASTKKCHGPKALVCRLSTVDSLPPCDASAFRRNVRLRL